MRVEKAIAVPAWAGFFNDDLAVIRAGARRDGFFYEGHPVTPGFDLIRNPSEGASIILLLDDGQVVSGDAVSVEYSGAGGRRTRFRHRDQLPLLGAICAALEGLEIQEFLPLCEWLEAQPFNDPTL